jgi:hypothetical protein
MQVFHYCGGALSFTGDNPYVLSDIIGDILIQD